MIRIILLIIFHFPILCFSQYNMFISAGPDFSKPLSYKSKDSRDYSFSSDFSWGVTSDLSLYNVKKGIYYNLSYSLFSSKISEVDEGIPPYDKMAYQTHHVISLSSVIEIFHFDHEGNSFGFTSGIGLSSFFYTRNEVEGWEKYRQYTPNKPIQYVVKKRSVDTVITSTDFSRLSPFVPINFEYKNSLNNGSFFLRSGMDLYPNYSIDANDHFSAPSLAYLNFRIQVGYSISL